MNTIMACLVIAILALGGAYFHEKDMLKHIDNGYVYTWTEGKIYINGEQHDTINKRN